MLCDGEAILARGCLSNASIVSSIKESENYELVLMPVTSSAHVAFTHMEGQVELWLHQINLLDLENIKRVVWIVDGTPQPDDGAKRAGCTVCVLRGDGNISRCQRLEWA